MAVRWGCYLLGGEKVCSCEMWLLPAGRGKVCGCEMGLLPAGREKGM